MNKSVALLIIDAQKDFCDPNGALYVPGAEKDMERLAQFIKKNQYSIEHICLTLDAHPYVHISHPCYWKSKEGKNPDPFTVITSQQVEKGEWIPQFQPNYSLEYLKKLEAQGQFPHVIWPYHCIAGTKGFTIVDILMEAIQAWSFSTGKPHQIVIKGTNPYTEHFGIFTANIPIENQKDTLPNFELLNQLNQFDYIYLAGEARSHCVATSLNQILQLKPEMSSKLIILQDCMSDVPGFGEQANAIYELATQKGSKLLHSENFIS